MEPLVLQDIKKFPAKFELYTVVVVGDIAFDRTFRCKRAPEAAHAHHGAEEIFDIEPQPDPLCQDRCRMREQMESGARERKRK